MTGQCSAENIVVPHIHCENSVLKFAHCLKKIKCIEKLHIAAQKIAISHLSFRNGATTTLQENSCLLVGIWNLQQLHLMDSQLGPLQHFGSSNFNGGNDVTTTCYSLTHLLCQELVFLRQNTHVLNSST